MSLSDTFPRLRPRILRRLGGVCALIGLLTGCGFQPLYGTSNGKDVPLQLQQIRVAPIPDRIGQKLRNFLLDRLNPKGQPARPLYTLTVLPTISRTNLGIQRDETATRALMQVSASYTLSSVATGQALYSGSERSVNSFNIVDSDFATLSAEKDALDRAAREISDAIRIRIGIFFGAGA